MKTIKTSFSASGFMIYFKSTILGILTGVASIITLSLIFSAVLLFSGSLPHNILIWFNIAACGVGSYIAGYTSAKITRHNAILTGILCSGCLFIILMSAGLMNGNNVTYITLIKLLVLLLFSIIGSIISVNKKEKLHIK